MPDALNSAGFVIYRELPGSSEPEFLLLKTSKRSGNWSFPKGRREPGETVEENALREVQEETGIFPEDLDIVPGFQVSEQYPLLSRGGQLKTVTCFLAKVKRPDQKVTLSDEHVDMSWTSLEGGMLLFTRKKGFRPFQGRKELFIHDCIASNRRH